MLWGRDICGKTSTSLSVSVDEAARFFLDRKKSSRIYIININKLPVRHHKSRRWIKEEEKGEKTTKRWPQVLQTTCRCDLRSGVWGQLSQLTAKVSSVPKGLKKKRPAALPGGSRFLSYTCRTWRSCWRAAPPWGFVRSSKVWWGAPGLEGRSRGRRRLLDWECCTGSGAAGRHKAAIIFNELYCDWIRPESRCQPTVMHSYRLCYCI